MKKSMTGWIPAALLMAAMWTGHAYGAQSAANPANPTTSPLSKSCLSADRSNVSAQDLLWSSAQESLKNGQYRQAREKFIQFTRQYRNNPQYKEALFYQGLCELKAGCFESRALDTWNQVLKLEQLEKTRSKASLLTLKQLVGYYERNGKDDEQKKALSRLLTDFPDDPVTMSLHIKVAEARLKASDYAGALAFYRPVEKKLSDEDRKNMELAETMAAKGGQNPKQLLASANESFEKNNVKQAMKLYQTLLKQNPNSSLTAEAKTKLGWSFYVDGKWQESAVLWREVIKQEPPKDKWVGQSRWHMIQLLAGPAGKPDKAIEMCEIQAKAFPNDSYGERALFSRAWLYWTQKQWVKAKVAFDDLFAAYPENANDPPVQVYVRECEDGIRNARGGGK